MIYDELFESEDETGPHAALGICRAICALADEVRALRQSLECGREVHVHTRTGQIDAEIKELLRGA